MKLSFLFSLLTLIFVGCPTYDPPYSGDGLYIENNSDRPIYVCLSCLDSLTKQQQLYKYKFWDANVTDENGNQKTDTIFPYYRIASTNKQFIPFYGSSKNKTDNCPDKKWRIFFISEKIMYEKTWTEIAINQLFEEKRIASQKELSDLKWIIKYSKKN